MNADARDSKYVVDQLIGKDINEYLRRHQYKSLLRFITCGSVDDGKSTLIGRLLYDAKMIFEDQLAALEVESKTMGTQGQEIDFALLVDGLAAEREQGITIDVAYRFFATEKRKFIVADTPGHEQYTRNMVTGASTADLAIILIDARKGVLTQTRRHSYLAHLIGIRNIVLAVNKMDLVGYDPAIYQAIVDDYRGFARTIGVTAFVPIPISGFKGDNITAPSDKTPWYAGPTLMAHLESVELDATVEQRRPFRLPVQWVNRPNLDFRGFAGLISGGVIAPGDAIRVYPSGKTSTVTRIVTLEGDLPQAVAGQSVTLCFADEIDCSRGDVITKTQEPLRVADQFESMLVWMHDEALVPGRPYWLKIGTRTVTASVAAPEYLVNVNTLEHISAPTLELNAIGATVVTLDRPIPFEAYTENRTLGGFILIDKFSNATVAAGMLRVAKRLAPGEQRADADITRVQRAALKHQKPALVWIAGGSTPTRLAIARQVERRLAQAGAHTYLLDEDELLHGLNADLGAGADNRVERLRRMGAAARLLTDAGLVVVASTGSCVAAERDLLRRQVPPEEFVGVLLDAGDGEADERQSGDFHLAASIQDAAQAADAIVARLYALSGRR